MYIENSTGQHMSSPGWNTEANQPLHKPRYVIFQQTDLLRSRQDIYMNRRDHITVTLRPRTAAAVEAAVEAAAVAQQ